MSKREFRIDGGRYGGELTIGKVDADFVKYWQDKDVNDLERHVLGLNWGDDESIDPNSPPIFEDEDCSPSWDEIDDIEHLCGYYSDSNFFVTEVTNKEDKFEYDESEKKFTPYFLFGLESYADEEEPENLSENSNYVPVLMWLSAEKGNFGTWFVETDGEDFNPKKFAIASVETNLAEMIFAAWYDKQELDADFEVADSYGKGYYGRVGWMNLNYKDDWSKYDENAMLEYWEGYDDNLNDEQ